MTVCMRCRRRFRSGRDFHCIGASNGTVSAGCRNWKRANLAGIKFERYLIGYFHVDLAEVITAEGKLYLFVAIDRTSKFAFVEPVERADMRAAATFPGALVVAVPYRIHTVITDNVLTRERKVQEKRRSLSIPYGMCLTTNVPPSGFHGQGLSVRP